MPKTSPSPDELATGSQEKANFPQTQSNQNGSPPTEAPRSQGTAQGGPPANADGKGQASGNPNAAPGGPPAQADDKADDKKDKKPRPAWVRPLIMGLVAVGVIVGAIYGWNYWQYSKVHVSTDDAYVTGNLVNVSPIISGTLLQLTVEEGDTVKKGQLLAHLDDAGPQATLRQEQANLRAALSQIPQAQSNLNYQEQATDAAIRKAQAALNTQQAKIAGAAQQVSLTSATVQDQVKQAQNQVQAVQAQADQAQAQVQAAQASVENYQQAIQTALASLSNYQQAIQTAQKAAQAAQSRVQAAQSEADRTAKDEVRYRTLYEEDAVSQQVYDNAHAQAVNARANLQAVQAEADQAQSQVAQARTGVTQAQSSVEQARKNVAQAQAQKRATQRAADAATKQVGVSLAGLKLAQANGQQVGIQQSNLRSTTDQAGEANADIATAQAGRAQIAVRRTQIQTYRSQAEQARAALTNAQVTLSYTKIYAPNDGMIVKKNANVGASLSPGQTIVTMSQGDYVWIVANFKETQLRDVRVGQPAEVEVDAFPKMIFKARVQSITEATGAATSLLPPDNATGNFTKVVQRVPVRIELVPASDNDDKKYARLSDIHNLRQGMSVVATIDVSKKGDSDRNGAQTRTETGPMEWHRHSLAAVLPYRYARIRTKGAAIVQ